MTATATASTPTSTLRRVLTIERPPPQPPAVRQLRWLLAATAAATVAVDLINLELAAEAGVELTVRTVWALLRAAGFLVLMRTVRYGRTVSRPIAIILIVSTVASVARLALSRDAAAGPPPPVGIGFAVLVLLCGAVLWAMFRSPTIAAHLSRTGPGRQLSSWLVTTRVAALSYSALLLVPCLVAAGRLGDAGTPPLAVAVPLVVAWFLAAVALGLLLPWVVIFVLFDKRLARGMLAVISVAVLVAGPALCLLLLGPQNLLRDGVPVAVAATICLIGLFRTANPPRP